MTDKLTLNEILEKFAEEIKNTDNEELKEFFNDECDNDPSSALKNQEFHDEYMGHYDSESFSGHGIYGGEGEGSDYRAVIRYKPTDQYFGASGWYASYDGGYLEDVTLMKPIQVIEYVNTK